MGHQKDSDLKENILFISKKSEQRPFQSKSTVVDAESKSKLKFFYFKDSTFDMNYHRNYYDNILSEKPHSPIMYHYTLWNAVTNDSTKKGYVFPCMITFDPSLQQKLYKFDMELSTQIGIQIWTTRCSKMRTDLIVYDELDLSNISSITSNPSNADEIRSFIDDYIDNKLESHILKVNKQQRDNKK